MSAQAFPPPIATTGRSRTAAAAQWLRWGLLGAFVVVLLLLPILGERQGRLPNLEEDIGSGRVSEVRVSGEAVSGEALESGTYTQVIHWRDDLVRRYVEVVSDREGYSEQNPPVVGVQGAEAYLRQQSAELSIGRAPERSTYGSLYGWEHLPIWLSLAYVFMMLGVLSRLIGGPNPLRATRWAWFWLWTTPFGAPLFLLLARPAPFLPTPAAGASRLTGGYAFLLICLLSLIF